MLDQTKGLSANPAYAVRTAVTPRLFGHSIASPVMRRGGGSLPESPLAQRALHPGKPLTQHMGIDLRGTHIRMPQQCLHGANVAATPE